VFDVRVGFERLSPFVSISHRPGVEDTLGRPARGSRDAEVRLRYRGVYKAPGSLSGLRDTGLGP